MLLDILPEIFVNLPVFDLLKCRRVCMAWKFVIEKDFLKTLCLLVGGSLTPDVWFIDNVFVDKKSVFFVKNLNLLSDQNFLHTFKNLKRLMIKANFQAVLPAQNLSPLGQLQQLEYLEIHGVPLWQGIESNSLKKIYYDRSSQTSSNLPNLATIAVYEDQINSIGPIEKFKVNLKVVIAFFYEEWILELRNVERLHITYAFHTIDVIEKPRVFVGRFSKLVLLDIYQVCEERCFIEILAEVDILNSTGRQIKFFHNGYEASNEVFRQREREVIDLDRTRALTVDLKRFLSIASDHPNLVRSFFYFIPISGYFPESQITSLNPPRFEVLKDFRNIKMFRMEVVNSDDARGLANIRQMLAHLSQLLKLLIFWKVTEIDEQFLDDLPVILENLIELTICTDELVLQSLHFLAGFKELLAFGAKYERNEKNQKIAELIEERKRAKVYPILSSSLCVCESDFGCHNYLV